MFSEKVKSKLIYFGAIIAMCTILVLLTYNYFLRTIKIDVMKDISLTYSGENGNATVTAINQADDLNKRTQEFLNTVTYEIEPNTNLSNGDTIHVTAYYDESIANQYHFQIKNAEKDFIVNSLNYRYDSLEDIDEEYLNKIIEEAQQYAENNQKQIYELNARNNDSQFVEAQLIYKAFMKSNSQDNSDRVVVVFKMIYEIEPTEEQEQSELVIYYTVTVPDVNDGNEVSNDMFGEKAYLTEDEYINENIEGYIQRLYNSQFEIYKIEDPESVIEELPVEE